MGNITIKDCGLFLIGNEEAIRKLAKSKSSLYLGAFFVLIFNTVTVEFST